MIDNNAAQQDQTTAAPVTNDVGAATTEAPVTRDDLAGMFKDMLAAEDGETPAQQAAAEPPVEQQEATAEAGAETEIADDQQQEATRDADQAQTPVVVDGMSEADKAVFDQLPPAMKSWISKRATEMRADYTKKTQNLAETRKATEADRGQLKAALDHYDYILAQFTAPTVAPPNEALLNSDPVAYDEQMAKWAQWKHNAEIAEKEKARVTAAQKLMQEKQSAEFFAEQEDILQAANSPMAGNTKQAKEARKAVLSYALKLGIPLEAMNGAGAQEIMILDKARRFDALQAAKTTAKTIPQPPPRAVPPGPARAHGQPTAAARAISNLSTSPSRDNLAASYEALLKAGAI